MQKVLEFDYAREALKYLVREFGIEKMHIPYYLCDVVRHSLVEIGCQPLFYHIDDDFYPKTEFPEEDFILYPNYFGICGVNTEKLVGKYPKLIVDNAHAYFDKPSGFACFNAGHKFGFEKSILRMKPEQTQAINGGEERKKEFLKLHSIYSESNLLNIDTETITVPFVYPCLLETTEKADKLVKELEAQGKTIYRYWNPLPQDFSEYKFYSRLVPIPLD